ncbi:MAG: porin family protein [Chitinophagaceae bacterium]
MRKIAFCFIAAFLLLAACFSVSAQVSLGIKAGTSISSFKNDKSGYDPENRVSVVAGGILTVPLWRKFQLRTELLYTGKGYKVASSAYSLAYTVTHDYITLPVLLDFSPVKDLHVMLGPELGYLFKARFRSKGYYENIKDQYKKVDIGVAGGIAYTFWKSLGVEVRYNYGLRKLNEYIVPTIGWEPSPVYKVGSNRNLQAGLYYLFTRH